MRLIDADPLLKKTHNYYPSIDHYCCSRKVVELRDIIEAPTIEAEPVKHGRWIGERCNHKPYRIKNPDKWVINKCSVCGYSNGRKRSNFCPNCGCKMDLED